MGDSYFFSISNQSGIACVSSAVGTLYQISHEEPLAIAVCPSSPIPWKSIVTDFVNKGEPSKRLSLEEYAKDFEEFLQPYQAKVAWNKLDQEKLKIIFLGYGAESIYPSSCNVTLCVDTSTNKLRFSQYDTKQISVDYSAAFDWNGKFSRLEPILFGRNKQTLNHMKKKLLNMFENYKLEIISKFENTPYDAYVKDSFCKYDVQKVLDPFNFADTSIRKDVRIGMGTFSIEEMVDSCEKIVLANNRLNLLLSKKKSNMRCTSQEVAVLTRTEGFSWLKHSKYAIQEED